MKTFDKLALRTGDRVVGAVKPEGSEKYVLAKGRVVDVDENGNPSVTFEKGQEPVRFQREAVFPLYNRETGAFYCAE